jgi:ubiquinone/menaquinone biosynthesis C-methylase UbiE/uncharacterized protein YbaR (Trm112 family)
MAFSDRIYIPVNTFCCPICKKSLIEDPASLTCARCGHSYPIFNGIPDFFICENEQETVEGVSAIWGDEKVVEARNTIYRLCVRELKGMAFCMQEIARRSTRGTRILEVGMGTGHFSRWLAEVTPPGTEIYAFDCSWTIMQIAQGNLRGGDAVTLFRANSRSKLPFPDENFDILFLRLAPLGPKDVPNIAAGYQILKPGGWYFEAGWDRKYENSWTAWAIQHGFAHAEHHAWQYPRTITEEEEHARQIEQAAWPADQKVTTPCTYDNISMTAENLLIAQKPFNPTPTNRSTL